MALTTEQEAKIADIITAFDNGKTLSELPDATSQNPFDLIVEVLDTDGESKKAKLAALLPYIEDECSYGIEYDKTVQATTCTRVGNMTFHKTLPIQSRMKGCLLDDDGNVVEYLNPVSWVGHTRDGSRGQVMVELPAHYRRFITNGNKRGVRLSEYPLPGYHYVPKMYVSAYLASLDRTNLLLSSVVNTSTQYRGGNNNANYDGAENSLLGMPATQISRTNFRTYARNRKSGSTEWNCHVYDVQKTLFWLYVVEYANLNCQLSVNAELTTEGYKQGGLGSGCSNLNWTLWSTFNGNNPFIPCGYTDSFGNGSGELEFTMPESYGSLTTYANRYRGVEIPFSFWVWTDGINVRISATEENGGDGLSKVFTCSDPSKFNDSNYTGYSHVGNEARAEGYIKDIIFGEYGDIIPTEVGGGSTIYIPDYHYTNIPTSGEVLRGVLFGGLPSHGTNCGFAYSYSNYVPSNAYASLASRLCFIPAA